MASRASPLAPSRPTECEKGDGGKNTTRSTQLRSQHPDDDSDDAGNVISLREALGWVLAAVFCVVTVFVIFAPTHLTRHLISSVFTKCKHNRYIPSSSSSKSQHVHAHRPPPTTYISTKNTLCATYASKLFQPTDRTAHIHAQAAFVKTILDVAFLGNYSVYTHPADMGLLRSGRYNNHPVDVLPFFNGAYTSSNRDNSPAAVNFLDGMSGTCSGGGGYKSHFRRAKDVDISAFTPAGCAHPHRYARTNQGRMRTQMERYLAKILKCDIAPPVLPAYDGRGLREVHKFMAVTDAELGYFIRQLSHAMIFIGVSPADSHVVGRTLRVAFEREVSTFENAKAEWRPCARPAKGKPLGPGRKKLAAQISTAMYIEVLKRQIFDIGPNSDPALGNPDFVTGGGGDFGSFLPTPTPDPLRPTPDPFTPTPDPLTPSPEPTPIDTPFDPPFDTPIDTATDEPIDTATKGPDTTTAPTRTSTSSTATGSATETTTASSSNSSLPAAVGGGVGGGLGVVLVAGVVAFFVIRRRRRPTGGDMPTAPTAQYGPMTISPAGLDGQEIGGIADAETGYGGIQGEQPGSRRPTPFFS
ncbi:hypothetical protein TWF696_008971 [Orbilia brochopaga]|uniref:Uncharacterized protein n=1 Tax=Orbilia brochopaga TaxID=3140254 RepID=A0AAV9UG73_9PEZI